MLLRLSKLAGFLTASPATDQAKPAVLNGLDGRLNKGTGVGLTVKKQQGPRAYAPRLSKV